jgi:SpoVK/Ycf46/Vps4 family AAA+-type ATPase
MANQKENFKRKTNYDKGGYNSSKSKKNDNDYYRDYYYNYDYHKHKQSYFTDEQYYNNEYNHTNQQNYNNERVIFINDLLNNGRNLNREDLLAKEEKNKKINYEYLILEIETIEDLIDLGKSYGIKYSKKNEYNIDLEMISKLVEPLTEFNKLVGLKNIKKQMVEIILYYSLRLDNKNQDLLHTVIEGEPGTGKTELAQHIANIYANIGILSKNIVKKVKLNDLKGQFLGHSAAMTEEILEECKGGVLFIDEAYSLGNSEGKNSKDVYSKEILDVLNLALTENKNDFICIIAGYKDDLQSSFFSFNDGLERRFPIRFSIEPYNGKELKDIFIKKVYELNWCIEDDAINEDFIENNKYYFKYNGGDMEILLTKCKIAHSKNLLRYKNKIKKILTKQDINYGLNIYLENPSIKNRNNIEDIKNFNMYL